MDRHKNMTIFFQRWQILSNSALSVRGSPAAPAKGGGRTAATVKLRPELINFINVLAKGSWR